MNSNMSPQIVQGNSIAQSGGVPPALFANADQPKRSRDNAYDGSEISMDKPIKKVVFLTTSRLEHQEIESHIGQKKEIIHENGTVYTQGRFEPSGCTWIVSIAEINSRDTVLEVTRAISCFKPDVVLFIGATYRINNGVIGDVVIPYEILECIQNNNTFQGTRSILTDYALNQRAKREAGKENWLRRAYPNTILPSASVHNTAPVATISNINHLPPDLLGFLKDNHPDAFVSDIPGPDFAKALQANNQEISATMVYGVSRQGSGSRTKDTCKSKAIAAKHAVAFAFEMLAKLHNPSSSAAAKTEQEPLAVVDGGLPAGVAKLLATQSESDDFCHICVFYNGKKYEASGKLAKLLGQIVEAMNSNDTVASTKYSFLIHCNVDLQENPNCPVNKVIQGLSATGFFGSQESYLIISDQLRIPWEFIEVNGVSIGVSIQTIYSKSGEDAAFLEPYACRGETLLYGEILQPIESCQNFPLLQDLANEMSTCEARYALLMIDVYSILINNSNDPTGYFKLSGFFSHHNRVVFVNGRTDFKTSVTHDQFLATLYKMGACGVISTHTALQDNDLATQITDLFVQIVRDQPLLTVPAILRSMRSRADKALTNDPSNEAKHALYLAVFQYFYYGKPYTTLQIGPVDSS